MNKLNLPQKPKISREIIQKIREENGTGFNGAKSILFENYKTECKIELFRFVSKAETIEEIKEAVKVIIDEFI